MNVICNVNSFFCSISYRLYACLIDPGDLWDGAYGIEAILLTHAHFDHIYGLNKIIEINPTARIYTNEMGKKMLLNSRLNMSLYNGTEFVFSSPDNIRIVKDYELIEIGSGLLAQAIFTPGHNSSCITWVIGDAVFTGDAYIPGVKVVTNLPGGNKEQAQKSLDRIKILSEGKVVYPGHKIPDRKDAKYFDKSGC